jgi:hypothetical protein
MSFQRAVLATPDLGRKAYLPGKQALKSNHAAKVQCTNAHDFTGSIDLERSLRGRGGYHHANLWDYGIGYRYGRHQLAIWIEIHPANSGQVDLMIRKLRWLKQWLREHARDLDLLTELTKAQLPGFDYCWIATDAGVHIRQGSPQDHRLRREGLGRPRGVLRLP